MSSVRRIHKPIKAKFNEVLGVISGKRPAKKPARNINKKTKKT